VAPEFVNHQQNMKEIGLRQFPIFLSPEKEPLLKRQKSSGRSVETNIPYRPLGTKTEYSGRTARRLLAIMIEMYGS